MTHETAQRPAAPGARVDSRRVIAITVAAVMSLGLVGLVGVAVLGGGDEPTGAGLGPEIVVAAPATLGEAATGPAAAGGQPANASSPVAPASDATEAPAGDGGDSPTTTAAVAITTVQAVSEIEAPSSGQALPSPGSDPVELPVLVTNPPPPSTYASIPLGELDPADVPELAGWTVDSRSDGHLALTDGDRVVDIFDLDGVSASAALTWFYDRIDGEVADLGESPDVRLGAPSSRYLGVLGGQFVATDAAQHGTTGFSGSVVTAGGADGDAVVIALTRPGTSSAGELAADGKLLRAILARL